MPYEFTPEERINNILHILDKLNDLLNSCDTSHEHLYADCIRRHMAHLDYAVSDMSKKEEE